MHAKVNIVNNDNDNSSMSPNTNVAIDAWYLSVFTFDLKYSLVSSCTLFRTHENAPRSFEIAYHNYRYNSDIVFSKVLISLFYVAAKFRFQM